MIWKNFAKASLNQAGEKTGARHRMPEQMSGVWRQKGATFFERNLSVEPNIQWRSRQHDGHSVVQPTAIVNLKQTCREHHFNWGLLWQVKTVYVCTTSPEASHQTSYNPCTQMRIEHGKVEAYTAKYMISSSLWTKNPFLLLPLTVHSKNPAGFRIFFT